MSFAGSWWEALFFYGVVFALGSAGTSTTPIGVLLSRWYPQRMGMANSIAISGMGLGQLLVISLLAAQLAALGWRGSFLALGIAMLICVLPFLLLARSAPGPAPAPLPAGAPRTAAPPERRAETLREALASRRLQLLLVIYAICGFQVFLFATHVVAFAVDEGVDVLFAGNILAFMGLAGVGGVLLTGVLNDRWGPVAPTAICFLLRVLLFAALLFSREPAVIAGAALIFGVTFWVTAPLTVVFGREIAAWSRLGAVTGFITMVHHSAGGLGALVGRLDLRCLWLLRRGVRPHAGPVGRRARPHARPAAPGAVKRASGERQRSIPSQLIRPERCSTLFPQNAAGDAGPGRSGSGGKRAGWGSACGATARTLNETP